MLRGSRSSMKMVGLLLSTASLLLSVSSCSGMQCNAQKSARALASVSYVSRGPVGIVQELTYFSDGELRLDATNFRSYCSMVVASERHKIRAVLESPDISRELENFGKSLRYPECFIQEEVTIEVGGRVGSARIDALNGTILALVEELERAAKGSFNGRYTVSVVERATGQSCRSAERPR